MRLRMKSRIRPPLIINSCKVNKGIKKLRALVFVAWSAILFMMAACNSTGCLDNRSSIPYAGFYSYNTLQAITIDSVEIGGIGAPNDSLLMESKDRYSNLYLPFRFEQDNTAFFIRYVSKALNYPWLIDTIRFDYKAIPMFVSEECGAMYLYEVTRMTYTTHLIDSIALTDSLITNVDIERIKIFFRTEHPGDDDGVDNEPPNGDDEPWEGDVSGQEPGEDIPGRGDEEGGEG